MFARAGLVVKRSTLGDRIKTCGLDRDANTNVDVDTALP